MPIRKKLCKTPANGTRTISRGNCRVTIDLANPTEVPPVIVIAYLTGHDQDEILNYVRDAIADKLEEVASPSQEEIDDAWVFGLYLACQRFGLEGNSFQFANSSC